MFQTAFLDLAMTSKPRF